MGKQRGEVFRITGARTGLAEDVRGRQRRYVISMSVRTLSVILAASLWNVERYVAIVALVLGALLPYVAVVIANAGRERPPSLPSTFVAMPSKPMITPPRAEGSEARAESGPRPSAAGPEAESRGEGPDRA
ncbi:DUF3099 domain-containing protein [Streptomyces sp. NPDC048208]|uniref:DUF3099 domain-containing protein n=1 Tax=unclassified Streptomyces TaxID=2593676 RepID=UPI00136A876D|nr:DUF3099 domain-containing protein [Streptomyces sp. SID4982]MYS15378.1 DUF3099 domain-containing protein [Streptomyces sp. SID4982]